MDSKYSSCKIDKYYLWEFFNLILGKIIQVVLCGFTLLQISLCGSNFNDLIYVVTNMIYEFLHLYLR